MELLGRKRFEGKVGIVTASTSGIGFEIARALAKEGARVVISSRRQRNVEEAEARLREEGLDVSGIVCHVGQREAIRKLIEATVKIGIGQIDFLVSNAAVNPTLDSLATTKEGVIDNILNINIKAAILLVQECLPYFSRDASILFNSSIAAFHSKQEEDILGMYSISKTALLGVTKAFANELGKQGIRVNCIAPGFIPTKLSDALLEDTVFRQKLEKSIPLGRVGTTKEIARVVVFLLSQDAGYITGETIVISGGMQSRL